MTPHTEFQKKYYQQVIEIHQKTGFSPRKIAKLQLVPVSVRQMYHWIAIFEAGNGKGSTRRIMEAKKSKEQEELEFPEVADIRTGGEPQGGASAQPPERKDHRHSGGSLAH